MTQRPFRLGVIGRPNVGKSSLFNRLTGTKHAIVEDTPGVTRDWREGTAEFVDLRFSVVDTAGLENAKEDTLPARMTQKTLQALEQVDAALLVVDGLAGLLPDDMFFAKVLRKSGKPVLLAVNKAEGAAANPTVLEASRLGFGEPMAISAVHGLGLDDLYHGLAPLVKAHDAKEDARVAEEDAKHNATINMVILGRPNAGKSTLMNHLLKEDRVLTGPEAGITRDAIAASWQWGRYGFHLVDTAGLRKKRRVDEDLEKMAGGDTLRALKFANVAVLMMDARESLEQQDLRLASLVAKEGRALVIAINKWDMVSEKMRKAYMKEAQRQLDQVLPEVRGVPMVPMSAKTGEGVEELLKSIIRMYTRWNKRVSTAQINQWLEDALAEHAPPLISGRRMKIRYATQIKTRPPTFALFGNYPDAPPDAYMRYLLHSLRRSFGMEGIPVRLLPRKPKNPYNDKKKGKK